MFDGILYFPITPFDRSGDLDLDVFATHVEQRMDAGPGGVFAACGTGEFHALSPAEHAAVVRRAVEVVGGRVPVFAGAGGALPTAKACAQAACEAGADGVLLLPPYLVSAPQRGLVAYAREVAAASPMPVIVYSRNNATLDVSAAVELANVPGVIGFKDGSGDVACVARIVSEIRASLEPASKPFWFFNGLPTAEVTVIPYRAIGVPLYSSAVFCFAPDISLAFYDAVATDDADSVARLLRGFFHPLVALRDRVPGYAVSLVKAGVRLAGLDAGGVRAPLVDPPPDHVTELERIIEAGRTLLAVRT